MELLVIVHPGSACGSADFNLGSNFAGRAARELLAADIEVWNGAILVIDGSLSDELPRHPRLNTAILRALDNARAHRSIAERRYGDSEIPPHQDETAAKFVADMKLMPAKWRIELTGAWADDDTGCVSDVRDVFRESGFATHIRDSALRIEDSDW
jgi:hypothetical protein